MVVSLISSDSDIGADAEAAAVFFQNGLYLLRKELFTLALGHAGKGGRVRKRGKLCLRKAENRVRLDTLEQVVVFPVELHLLGGLDSVLPDGLMENLPGSPGLCA